MKKSSPKKVLNNSVKPKKTTAFDSLATAGWTQRRCLWVVVPVRFPAATVHENGLKAGSCWQVMCWLGKLWLMMVNTNGNTMISDD